MGRHQLFEPIWMTCKTYVNIWDILPKNQKCKILEGTFCQLLTLQKHGYKFPLIQTMSSRHIFFERLSVFAENAVDKWAFIPDLETDQTRYYVACKNELDRIAFKLMMAE